MNRNKHIQAALIVGVSMAIGFGLTKVFDNKATAGTEAAVVDYTNVQDSPEVKRGIASLFSEQPQPSVNLIQIGNPVVDNDPALFTYSAPQDSVVGSLTASTDLNINDGQLQLSNNFTNDFIGATSMTEGDYLSIELNYAFMTDGMITWDNVVADNPHHKWESHPEYIPVKSGNRATVTYRYDPATQDWTASVKVMS